MSRALSLTLLTQWKRRAANPSAMEGSLPKAFRQSSRAQTSRAESDNGRSDGARLREEAPKLVWRMMAAAGKPLILKDDPGKIQLRSGK